MFYKLIKSLKRKFISIIYKLAEILKIVLKKVMRKEVLAEKKAAISKQAARVKKVKVKTKESKKGK